MNIKKIVPEYLISKNYKIMGSYLICYPVHDLLKGFCFEKVNSHLYLSLFFQPLCAPSEDIHLTYGWRIKGKSSYGNMFFLEEAKYDPEIPDLLIENESKVLSQINNIENFFYFFDKSNQFNDLRYIESLVYCAYYINSNKKEYYLNEFNNLWNNNDYKNVDWMINMKKNLDIIVNSNNLNDQFKNIIDNNLQKFKLK